MLNVLQPTFAWLALEAKIASKKGCRLQTLNSSIIDTLVFSTHEKEEKVELTPQIQSEPVHTWANTSKTTNKLKVSEKWAQATKQQ